MTTDIPIIPPKRIHASQHQHGGSDEVATATPANNAIPKAEGDGKLASGWIDAADVVSHYNSQVAQVSGGEISAGTETGIRRYSPADIVAIVAAHESGGGSLPQPLATSDSPTFAALTTTGAVSAGGQVSSVATIGLLTSHVTTDATNKTGIVAARHYTNANRPIGLVASTGTSSANTVYIGGGLSDVNAATEVIICTTAGNNTATGAFRSRWAGSGERQDYAISATPGGTASRATWWADTSGNPYVRIGTGRIIDIGALGLTATAVQTGNYTAAAGELVLVDPSSASADITITLPATATPCAVMVVANAAGPWNVLIGRNGNTVNDSTDTSRFAMRFSGQAAFFRPESSGYVGQCHIPPNNLKAYDFNGSTHYPISNTSAINITGTLSLSFWMYLVGTGNQIIWGGYNPSGSYEGYGVSVNEGGADRVSFWDGTAWRNGTQPMRNRWRHVVMSYNGSSSVSIYVDGRLDVSVAAGALSSYTGVKAFGAVSGGTTRFSGLLQDLRIFNVALTAANVETLWNNGRGWPMNTISGLVAWYLGNEGSGSTAVDLVSANNGTVSGTAAWASGIVQI